jgi:cyclophilin family peptidyl-prolyl cis-trans isomerase
MKKQRYALIFIIFTNFLLFSCENSKDIDIPQDKVAEVLTEYGKQNPETEVIIHVKKYGDIHIKLYEETPLHRANFIRLIKYGHFNHGDFYRIVSDFMIQGGNQGVKEQKYMIPAEFNNKYIHKKGALSMARRDENNPEKRSSPTEFFIIRGRSYTEESLKDAVSNSGRKFESYPADQIAEYLRMGGDARIDHLYTVFGEVTQGIEIVEQIADLEVYDVEKPIVKPSFTIELK